MITDYSFRTSTRRRATAVTCACVAVSALATSSSLAQSVTSGGFVATLGKDTVAFEQYTRTGNVLTGDYVTVQGGVTASHYVIKFDVNNMPSELVLTQMRGDGSPIPGGPSSVKMTVGEAETTVDILKEPPVHRKFAVKLPYPLLGTSIAMFEVAMQRLRTLGTDSVSFAGLPLNAPELPNPIQVKFVGADSARVWTAGGPMYMRVTRNGEIHGVSGRATDVKIEVRRVPVTQFKALMTRFTK
ncbi:MAG: hypothetical protein ACO1Q7_08035 [Gemmatimonas sp.]